MISLFHKQTTPNQQHGAAEARRAHNPEVPRSKRGVAIIYVFFIFFPIFGASKMAMVQFLGNVGFPSKSDFLHS